MPECKLCKHYIQDTLDSAAGIEFPARRAARIRPHLAGLSYEIKRSIEPIFGQVESYRSYKNQLEMMMTFVGVEKMLVAFYENQPSIQGSLRFWSFQLVDAGLGRPDIILAWLQKNFYKIFTNLIDVHREHTQEQSVGAAAVPAIDLYGCVRLEKPVRQTLPDRERFREEDQFEDIDDLYA
jgi:hypothetical protein